MTISGKVFGIGAESSMSMEVSTSHTEEQTSEESVAYTVPSQSITIPPKSTRYVNAVLERAQLEGILRLKADLSCLFTVTQQLEGGMVFKNTVNLYEFVKEAQIEYPLPSGISLDHNKKTIHFEGVADYFYGTGTKFHVTVTDTASPTRSIEKKPFDSTTGLGTYEIGLDNKKLGFTLDSFKESTKSEVFES